MAKNTTSTPYSTAPADELRARLLTARTAVGKLRETQRGIVAAYAKSHDRSLATEAAALRAEIDLGDDEIDLLGQELAALELQEQEQDQEQRRKNALEATRLDRLAVADGAAALAKLDANIDATGEQLARFLVERAQRTGALIGIGDRVIAVTHDSEFQRQDLRDSLRSQLRCPGSLGTATAELVQRIVAAVGIDTSDLIALNGYRPNGAKSFTEAGSRIAAVVAQTMGVSDDSGHCSSIETFRPGDDSGVATQLPGVTLRPVR